MPSFRKAPKQAAYVVRQVLALGTARHTHRHDGQIHSVGTARAYQQAPSRRRHNGSKLTGISMGSTA